MRIRSSASPFNDSENTARSSLGYAARLARQKGLLELVFNTIKEGILVIDERLSIKYHNRAAAELLGLPENIERVKLSQFLKEIDFPLSDASHPEAWEAFARTEVEILYPSHRWIRFYKVPHEQGSGEATVILQDVTEEKERTREFIESERMRLVSMLAAGVAHEIGNPLNSLYLHLQLMERELRRNKSDPEEFLEMVGNARKEVERLDGIIRQFLSALRPDKGVFSAVSLPSVAAETVHNFELEAAEKGVALHCTAPAFFPAVSGNPDAIRQALLNLLKNALQATPRGGEVCVSCLTEETNACLMVSDSGCGIPASEFGHIFDPFHTTKSAGTGLGLMVVDRVMREHGGSVRVRSELGGGSVFTLVFPLSGRVRTPPMLPPCSSEGDLHEKS